MRRSRVVIGTAAGLLLVGGGTALGAVIGPIDSAGVVHGCYTTAAINGSHAFVLQDDGTTCPRGTTAIQWNQTGQRGPAGADGADGADGAQGPPGPSTAGPAGLDTELVTYGPYDNLTSLSGTCPADHPHILGGGGYTESGAITGSAPYELGWVLNASERGTLTIVLICSK
jgi:hypothetical protein